MDEQPFSNIAIKMDDSCYYFEVCSSLSRTPHLPHPPRHYYISSCSLTKFFIQWHKSLYTFSRTVDAMSMVNSKNNMIMYAIISSVHRFFVFINDVL